jgi:hypothetical protein
MWRLCWKWLHFLFLPRCFCALFLLLLAGLCCLPFLFLGQAILLPVSLVFLPSKKIFLPPPNNLFPEHTSRLPIFPCQRKTAVLVWSLGLLLQDANAFFSPRGLLLQEDVTRGPCLPLAFLQEERDDFSFFSW